MNAIVTALKYNRVNFINGPVMARVSNEQVTDFLLALPLK